MTDTTAVQTDHDATAAYREGRRRYRVAAIAGVAAGLAFGLLIQFGLGRMPAIGALYTLGDPNLSVGWLAHLAHSVAFGAGYGFLVGRRRLATAARDPLTGPVLGLAYGLCLWAVNIVFLWPLWLSAVGLPGAPTAPFLAPLPLVGHLLWGGLLGVLYVVWA